MNILIVEDDLATVEHVKLGLSAKGHTVTCVSDGAQGVAQAMAQTFDVIVLDRMLPGMDGVSVLKTLRKTGQLTPVIFLTAIGGLDDRVEGLDAGADDYLVKPFAIAELLSRVNALSRRSHTQTSQAVLQFGTLEMNLLKREVRRDGKLIDLHPQEFKILEYLVRNEGRPVTKLMLLQHVWGFSFDPKTTVVETHMSRLRTKLDYGFDRSLIIMQRGIGYSLAA